MPHYFFHIIDDLHTADDEGAELGDLAAARGHAIASARVLMCETLTQDGRINLAHRIDIEDEARRVVDSVAFEDAIDIRQ